MSSFAWIILLIVFFLTSVIGVVTGSNSLITVPIMFQFGVDPRVAVATNMFGLLFMSIGATIPFVRQRKIDYRELTPSILITLIGSALGAVLVGFINASGMKFIVSTAMIAVALFILLRTAVGVDEREKSRFAIPITYGLVFVLGIYGGLFSGGYITVLTAVYVGIYGMRYGQAVASTKLINVFSSGIATLVFMWQGLVDYRLGVALAVTMFIGAYAGAHYVTKLDDIWLRRIFLSTVFVLAVKTIFDLFSG
jgi:uncharacterized membrane protein YfcA